MVMSSVSGSASDIPQKQKYYDELTDQDIYTWVTLLDCELPVRKGSLTPINEGYARSTGAKPRNEIPDAGARQEGQQFLHADQHHLQIPPRRADATLRFREISRESWSRNP